MTAVTVAAEVPPFRSRRRPARRLRTALGAAGLAAVLAGCSSAQAARSTHVAPPVPGPLAPNSPFVTTAVAAVPPAPAPSAQEAVQRYVAAEAAGDSAASWALLADADRARAGSLAAWVDEASDRLPLRSLGPVTLDGSTVVTDAVLDARLDEGGFVPGRARIEWRPVAAGGGWLVSPNGTRVLPELPADADAVAVVDRWLQARQRGESTGQYAGNLLGQPTLAAPLPAGTYHVGAVRPLDAAPDAQVAVNAFGPGASRFVRAVAVDGPARLAVLVAPLGDAWQVVGVEASG